MIQVVDDFSSRFDEIPMQVIETINANHREMVRFRNEACSGYRQVSGALRNYVSYLTPKDDAKRICTWLRSLLYPE